MQEKNKPVAVFLKFFLCRHFYVCVSGNHVIRCLVFLKNHGIFNFALLH